MSIEFTTFIAECQIIGHNGDSGNLFQDTNEGRGVSGRTVYLLVYRDMDKLTR